VQQITAAESHRVIDLINVTLASSTIAKCHCWLSIKITVYHPPKSCSANVDAEKPK